MVVLTGIVMLRVRGCRPQRLVPTVLGADEIRAGQVRQQDERSNDDTRAAGEDHARILHRSAAPRQARA